MSLVNAIKSIDYGKYLARGVGAAALYIVAKDSHTYGKIQADIDLKSKNAKSAQYYLNNTLTLDKPSITQSKMKDAIYKYELDDNLRGFVNSTTGYFKGLGSMMISKVMALGLGIAALSMKGRGLPFAKASALGLIGMGLYSFVKDGLGIGKANDLTKPY